MSAFTFLPVTWYDSLPSTNSHLIADVKSNPDLPSGTVIAARTQTAGRGRQQRQWLTTPNENLTFSFLWNAPLEQTYLPAMAQAISVGIAHFLQKTALSPTIKWPNDILVQDKKIGGILCESVNTGHPDRITVVAGAGLNINMDAAAAARIDQPVTSLFLETDTKHELDETLTQLLASMSIPLQQWANSGFAGIRHDYSNLGWTPGTTVRVRDGEKHVTGTFLEYNHDGGLVLQGEDGTRRLFYSGDAAPATAQHTTP